MQDEAEVSCSKKSKEILTNMGVYQRARSQLERMAERG